MVEKLVIDTASIRHKKIKITGEWDPFAYYIIHNSRWDKIRSWLKQHLIQTGIHNPVLVHIQPAYTNRLGHLRLFPHSELAANEVMSLPIYPGPNMQQINYNSETIINFLDKR